MNDSLLLYGAYGSLATSIAIVTYGLAATPPAVSPHLGRRGMARQRALAENRMFARIEPLMRFVAGLFARLPLSRARARADVQLTASGDYLGLSPDEYFALSLLGGVAGLILGLGLGGGNALYAAAGCAIGVLWPRHKVGARANLRVKQLSRGLPPAIDLMALCLGAGLDFPGALGQVIEGAQDPDDALVQELRAIRRELELGHTRRAALEGFADRVGTEEVRDFVSAVVQAEAKGNPLAEVLRIQAEVLRQRRTVKGEEAAARASVLMIGPLVMLILAVMILILAPLLIRSMSAFQGVSS